MPANLTQTRAKIAELKAKTDSSTGYADILEDVLDLLGGVMNEFGTAATVDTGSNEGNIALLGAGGDLPVTVIPDGLDLASSMAEVVSVAEDRELVNARQIDGMFRWQGTPGSHTVWGNPGSNTGGTTITTTGIRARFNTGQVRDYRSFIVRYLMPGRSVPIAAVIAQPWADGTWRRMPDVDGSVSAVSYRQETTSADSLSIRSTAAGYNLLSIQGVNPDYDYWGRGFKTVHRADRNLTVLDARRYGAFRLDNDGQWRNFDLLTFPPGSSGGPWMVTNASTRQITVRPLIGLSGAFDLNNGKTALVMLDPSNRMNHIKD